MSSAGWHVAEHQQTAFGGSGADALDVRARESLVELDRLCTAIHRPLDDHGMCNGILDQHRVGPLQRRPRDERTDGDDPWARKSSGGDQPPDG